MNKLRILHVVVGRPKKEASNGVLRSVYFLSQAQSEEEHNVHILSLTAKKRPSYELQNNVKIYYGKYFALPILCNKTKNFLNNKKLNYDVIHYHSAYHIQYKRIQAYIDKKIPYLISPRGSYQKQANNKNKFVKRLYKHIYERNFRTNAASIHVLNENEKSDSISYGIAENKLKIIYNGLPKKLLNEYEFQSSSKKKNLINLVYCGRLTFEKGIDFLIDALSIIKKRGELDISLNLIGPFDQNAEEIFKRVSQKGLDDRVIFHGSMFGDNKIKIFQSSDLFILPSKSEGFPTGVVEAMMFGIPCVVSEECNIPEYVSDEQGIKIFKLNVNEIVKILYDFSFRKENYFQMGKVGQNIAYRDFEIRPIARQHINNYLSIIKKND